MKKIAAAAALVLGLTAVGTGSALAADEVPGTSPGNPIVVADPSLVPPGAVGDEESTYDTPEACDTTRSWVLTIPANEETSHQEFRVKRDIPAVTEISHTEYRFGIDQRTFTPAQDSTEHTEYLYQRTVPGQHHDAVTHEEYHFSKFTQTRSRTYTQGTPAGPSVWANFAPTNTRAPFVGPAIWPTDPRGKWIIHNAIPGGHAGPDGVYAKGNPAKGGNWFYRLNGTPAVPGGWGPWSDFGPWTQWSPITHESWELSTDPLGSPQPHASWQTGNTQYERVWQARFDGGTRTVTDSEAYDDEPTVETSDWLTSPPAGDGWEQIDNRQVSDDNATPASFGPWEFKEFTPWTSLSDLPADPDLQSGEDNFLNLLRIALADPETRTVIDREFVPGYTEFYVLDGTPSLNEADASWLLSEQIPEGWTQFDERSVGNGDSTPEIVTYYAYTDGAECDKPEGYNHSSSTEECVNGDLVTTETTETGTPVQAEDGSWTIEETATSSQSVKQDAAKCTKHTPPTPPNPTPPGPVPTSIDAGLDSYAPATDENTYLSPVLVTGLAGLMTLIMVGMTVAHSRRRGTEK